MRHARRSAFVASVLLPSAAFAAADELLLTRQVNTSVIHDKAFALELAGAAAHTIGNSGVHLAVVVPTCTTRCPADLARLEVALARWSEPQHLACPAAAATGRRAGVLDAPLPLLPNSSSCEISLAADAPFYAHLLLYMDAAAPETERRIEEILAAGRARRCFQAVTFLSARLAPSDNTYPRAPNLMFYKIALHLIQLQAFNYFLILEADVTPLQPNWLPALAAHLPPRSARFWVKGSTGRGTKTCQECRHINGNALYHARDPEFGRFVEKLFTSQAKFEERKHSRRIGFDSALHYSMLLKGGAASAMFRHEVGVYARLGGRLDGTDSCR